MKCKKAIILLVLVVFLLGIACVSASEIDDTIASGDTDSIEMSADNDDNNDKLTLIDNDETLSANNTEISEDNTGTYSGLKEEIGSGGNIELQHNYYTYDTGDTISITDANSVIDGKGAVIDMAGSNIRAFSVSASSVTIKNLTIKNANFSGDGGAIYVGGSATLTNCNFIKNNANGNGGAVFFLDDGTVTNCNFTNNTAIEGGAIYFSGSSDLANCNFVNNSARYGGAVYFEWNNEVTDCNFTDNTAYNGGAVYLFNNGVVTDCNFAGNKATGDDSQGGAVYFYGTYSTVVGTVKNCNFTDNSASYGGAIKSNAVGTVTDCNFDGNKATGDDSHGGAVYIHGGTVKNCNFTDNTAANEGGAVYLSSGGAVTDCKFTNNSASYGGAIYLDENGDVTDCNFVNNSASYGGAIDFDKTGTVSNCNFADNSATESGGAILLYSGTVSNCNFADNSATESGGAILLYSGTVSNCNFADNSASYGGAIDFNRTGTVTDCDFADNSASYGGAVYFSRDGAVENCSFTNNQVTGADSWGGAIMFVSTGNVTNCDFTDNHANYGGAVYFSVEGTVENCNLTNNSATQYGGAVYFSRDGAVENCSFTNNQVTGADSWGGAIMFVSTGNVTNCDFTDNHANYGGAVYFSVEGTVENCNLTNNSATQFGGAVYFAEDVIGRIENCSFTDNSAFYGGAVFMYSGSVENCNFINNTAIGPGGAVFFNKGCNVTNCNFTDNNATTGSAIYFLSTSATKSVSNSRFLNNRANSVALEVTKNDNSISITFTGNDNLLNAIYSPDDVSFTNVTYWGANGIANTDSSTPSRSRNEVGQNITIGVVVNDKLVLNEVKVTDENGMIVLDINAGENYYITARHDTDSYYTEKETIISNMTFNVNVTPQTTHNKTVNITAKSNIFSEVMDGKLLFIVPDGTAEGMEINANYAGNGTWWAVYTFDDYTDYQVNARYVGLDNVAVRNATISISKTPTEIIVENETVELLVDDSVGTGAYLTPADAGNLTFTSSNITIVTVEDGKIIAVGEGNAVITVSFAGNDDYVAAENKTIGVTVKLRDASVIVNNSTLNLLVDGNFTIVPTTIPSGLTVTFISDNSGVYSIDENGLVTALKEGTGSIAVIVGGDGVYALNSTVVSVSVSKVPTEISVLNDTLVLEVLDEIASGVTLIPADAGNVTYTVSNSSVVKVENGKIKAIWEGTANIVVSFAGDDKYAAAENKTIGVTVKLKDASVSVNNSTLNLLIGDNFTIVPTTNPAGLAVTFIPDDSDAYIVDRDGRVTALKEGTGFIAVIVGGDGVYALNSTVVSVSVSKVPTEISVLNDTLVLEVRGEVATGVSLTPADAGNVTYTVSNSSVVKVEDGKIIALSEGSAIIMVSFAGDEKYVAAENKTIGVTVKLRDASISVNNSTLDLFVGETFTIVATTVPSGLNVTFVSDDSGVYNITNGVVTALKEGTGSLTVKVGGDGIYAENSTVVSVSVSKVPTEITVENDNIVLEVNDEIATGVTLTPAEAGNVTYTVSNSSVVKIENGNIKAIGDGAATITVSFAGDDKYAEAVNKTISVTVNLRDASVSVNNRTLELLVGGNFTIVVTTVPSGLNVTFVSDDSGVYSIENGVVTALKEGTGSLTVKVGGDGVYAENFTVVSVSVSKVPTEITVENDNIVLQVNDEIATGATLIPSDAGNVTYTVSNSSVVKVENGKIIAISQGVANITVSFAGDEKYVAAENKTIGVTVKLRDASVSVNNSTLDLFVGETFTIVATTIPEGLNVTFLYDGADVYSVDENGVVTALKEGTGYVTVYVGNDSIHALNVTFVSVTVSKVPTEITVEKESVELIVGGSVGTGATLTPADAGNLTFTSNNISVAIVEDGKIIAVGEGSAVITVSFAGDDKYAEADNKTISVDVDAKYKSKVIISPIEGVVYPNDVLIKYSVENRTNVSVSIAGVSDDKIIITNDTVTVIGLDAGEYTITIINNESDIYRKSSDTKTFTVNKQATSIAAAAVSAVYNKNKVLVITLKDGNGKALANAKVTVVLGKSNTYTTDKNGQVKVSTKGLKPKTYTAKITFNGNTNYAKSTKNVKVTVKKATPKMTAKKKTFKRSVKVKKYSIVLKNNVGKAIKKAKVTIKIGKKKYTAKTNSKGKATFKIKKLTKKGTYKAKVTYNGNAYYKKVTKTVKIKIK